MVLLGLIGVVISIAGVFYGRQLIDDSFAGLDSTLFLTSESLDTAVESLELAKTTIGDVNDGLDTVEGAAINIARTVTDTRPLINQIAVVVSEDTPAAIDAMTATIPNIAEVAGAIDQTLTALNDFSIDENILGQEIHYDLGIEYDPQVPFDESFLAMGESLEGLPDSLRASSTSLAVTSDNLATISQCFVYISAVLETIHGRIAEVPALIDQYIEITTQLNNTISQLRLQVVQQQSTTKNVITFILIWWGLPQLALAMIGWDFLFGRRGATADEIREEIMEEIEDDIEELQEELENKEK
jgi:methyl-accepting chemotaxis protein